MLLPGAPPQENWLMRCSYLASKRSIASGKYAFVHGYCPNIAKKRCRASRKNSSGPPQTGGKPGGTETKRGHERAAAAPGDNHSLASPLASVMALRASSLPGSYFRIRTSVSIAV